MKRAIVVGTVVLFGLALVPVVGDAGGKKKKTTDPADVVAPKAEEVPKYMKMLTAPSGKDRALAAKKLGLRGMVNANDVIDAVDPLRTMLEKDTDAKAREAAARALGNIQPDPKETVPTLTRTVKDDKVMDVRLAATVALGQYGAEAKEALPTLREFAGTFDNKKSQQYQTVMQAVKMISGKKK